MAAILGVVLLAVTTVYQVESSRRQLELADQVQITGRFSTAVEQLGHEKVEVRVGAVYALERIIANSPKDQPNIVETLSTFIREQAPIALCTPEPKVGDHPRADIQAALTVIGRRNLQHDAGARLGDLRRTCLIGADLTRAKLPGGNLTGADLTCAVLVDADLTGADLTDIGLGDADMTGARGTTPQQAESRRGNKCPA